MPYALIPDGYTLKKVNKGELEAVNNHNRAQAIRRFTGSRNSSVILLVAIAVGLYFLAKQIEIPTFSLTQSFAHAFPQVSAILGITKVKKMTPEQEAKLNKLMTEGAGEGAGYFMQFAFPTPEQKAASALRFEALQKKASEF